MKRHDGLACDGSRPGFQRRIRPHAKAGPRCEGLASKRGTSLMTAVKAGQADQAPPSASEPGSWNFADVFSAEYRDLYARCDDLPGGAPNGQTPTVENGLIGVSLSGGGIRSSTFCLGALQSMNC